MGTPAIVIPQAASSIRMASILRAYNSALVRKPRSTGMASAAVLFGAGDILAQQGVEKKGWRNHDVIRTTRLAFYGGVIFAPILMPWFKVLDRIQYKSKVLTTVTRVAADQFIAAPCLVGLFFASMSVLEGRPQDITNRLKEKWQPTIFKNWMVFIPTQAVNMSIVPPPLRLLVVNVVSLFWNTYLSWANSAAAPPALVKNV